MRIEAKSEKGLHTRLINVSFESANFVYNTEPMDVIYKDVYNDNDELVTLYRYIGVVDTNDWLTLEELDEELKYWNYYFIEQ